MVRNILTGGKVQIRASKQGGKNIVVSTSFSHTSSHWFIVYSQHGDLDTHTHPHRQTNKQNKTIFKNYNKDPTGD